jgi:SAM-dependent methyltransferase
LGTLQSRGELDAFYSDPDPWAYEESVHDKRRLERLLSLIPARSYESTLDIGCGNGFVTEHLPGDRVLGLDLSDKAVNWARQRTQRRPDGNRFDFQVESILDLETLPTAGFDLVAITGVLYPQYIGKATAHVERELLRILRPDGILISCHVAEWCKYRFPLILLDATVYPYREYTHRLEVYLKR